MRAWILDEYSGVKNLRAGELEDPRPGPGEIEIATEYASLNPADAFLALGRYPAHPPLPHILGRDGVGRVISAGEGVTNFKPGDLVGVLRSAVGVERWGTLAARTVVPCESAVTLPAGWTAEQLAAAPLVYLTAWQAITQWSEFGEPYVPGSVLLITGASGGVGVASVQLGKALGYTLIALSRSEDKSAKLRALGADITLNPEADQWQKQSLDQISPQRVRLAIENVCGENLNRVLDTLARGAAVSVVGMLGGPVPKLDTTQIIFKRLKIGGVFVSDYTPRETQAAWRRIVATLEKTGAKPLVDRIFDFDQVKEAFAYLAKGPMGKVLVRVR